MSLWNRKSTERGLHPRNRKYCRYKSHWCFYDLKVIREILFFSIFPVITDRKEEESVVFLLPRSLLPKPVPVFLFTVKGFMRAQLDLVMYLQMNVPLYNIVITSSRVFHHVISVLVPDKVLWSGFLGSVIQLTYVFKYDIVIALTSDFRIARLSAVK